jgi:hypothetical protein
MKDTRRHYPKEPITFNLLPNVWKTAGTMCNKRRAIDWVTDSPELVTCEECRTNALVYWTEQEANTASLIEYADAGLLKGTSAEAEAEDLMSKLREALTQARIIVKALGG